MVFSASPAIVPCSSSCASRSPWSQRSADRVCSKILQKAFSTCGQLMHRAIRRRSDFSKRLSSRLCSWNGTMSESSIDVLCSSAVPSASTPSVPSSFSATGCDDAFRSEATAPSSESLGSLGPAPTMSRREASRSCCPFRHFAMLYSRLRTCLLNAAKHSGIIGSSWPLLDCGGGGKGTGALLCQNAYASRRFSLPKSRSSEDHWRSATTWNLASSSVLLGSAAWELLAGHAQAP
mmetsp:Transcript_11481/g.42870  ORF Transcript_11481/g.42870 Transcript_11481/m.42870 type:complete len:235 (+) Transcript_11481:4379-5083(+)